MDDYHSKLDQWQKSKDGIVDALANTLKRKIEELNEWKKDSRNTLEAFVDDARFAFSQEEIVFIFSISEILLTATTIKSILHSVPCARPPTT